MNSNGFISAGNEPGVHACDAKGMDIRQMPLTFACAAHLLVYNKIPDLCIPFFLHFQLIKKRILLRRILSDLIYCSTL